VDKLKLLINYVGPAVYDHISESSSYDDALKTLELIYVKPMNEVFARHQLATRKQLPGESLDQYLLALKKLAKDGSFKAVSAEDHRQEAIRDAFITGLQSPLIRQRLLENQSLTLDDAVKQARSLDLAQRNAEVYVTPDLGQGRNFAASVSVRADSQAQTVNSFPGPNLDRVESEITSAAATGAHSCSFCGKPNHPRFKCPARNAE